MKNNNNYSTYMSNVQEIIQMYQDLIMLALVDNDGERLSKLIIERNDKLDELRMNYFNSILNI